MTSRFITIIEATKMTGKSRRTMQRLVESLLKKQPDQVMQEKTPRGYIWKLSEQCVQQAYGVSGSQVEVVSPISQHQAAAPPVAHSQSEKYMEVVGQAYAGMMTMHQDLKQSYDERLQEKERQIAELKQSLAQAKKGFWGWLFG